MSLACGWRFPCLGFLALTLMVVLGCGHSIGPGLPSPSSPIYDFRHPTCYPSSQPDHPAPNDRVILRYLGAGGLYVGWRDEALLTAPFFSNPGYLRTGLGRIRWRREAIEQGLKDIPGERVGAILAGHSHYDHLGDLPVVAREWTPRARLYLNESGANALTPYRDLRGRVSRLEGLEGQGQSLVDATGRRLPFRVRAIPSGHAPHLGPVSLWMGSTEVGNRPWERRRHGFLQAGQPYALVIELLDSAEEAAPTRFRIYYQDAAVQEPLGIPPEAECLAEPAYDLAVVCMASAHLVEPYPTALLRCIQPRHVLVTHYENFFRRWGPERGFVPLLTRRRANRFLRRVAGSLFGESMGPASEVCGPSSSKWTMPLVSEWLEFSVYSVGE